MSLPVDRACGRLDERGALFEVEQIVELKFDSNGGDHLRLSFAVGSNVLAVPAGRQSDPGADEEEDPPVEADDFVPPPPPGVAGRSVVAGQENHFAADPRRKVFLRPRKTQAWAQ